MKRKVSINTGCFQGRYGDKGVLDFAARIGADAVDFDLFSARWDYRKPDSVYAKSNEEIRAYFKEIARGRFGRDFAEEEAAFAVSVLRHFLDTRYGKE